MNNNNTNNIIAVDVDGVILNYQLAWIKERNKFLKLNTAIEKKGNYFHAHSCYGVPAFDSVQRKNFYKYTHASRFWANMPAIEGVIDELNKACLELDLQLVCITSMPKSYEGQRVENLLKLGLNFSKVIATSRRGSENPKKSFLQEIKPIAFIDDLRKNFEDVGADICTRVLLNAGYLDNPNAGLEHIEVDHVVTSIKDFVSLLPQLIERRDNNLVQKGIKP